MKKWNGVYGMTIEEIIKRLRYKAENIKAHLEPEYFSECADYLEQYRWHDLRKVPDDLPKTTGCTYVPCLVITKYDDSPVYAKYDFFEGYRWDFFGFELNSIVAWKEIEPFEEKKDEM